MLALGHRAHQTLPCSGIRCRIDRYSNHGSSGQEITFDSMTPTFSYPDPRGCQICQRPVALCSLKGDLYLVESDPKRKCAACTHPGRRCVAMSEEPSEYKSLKYQEAVDSQETTTTKSSSRIGTQLEREPKAQPAPAASKQSLVMSPTWLTTGSVQSAFRLVSRTVCACGSFLGN